MGIPAFAGMTEEGGMKVEAQMTADVGVAVKAGMADEIAMRANLLGSGTALRLFAQRTL